MCGLLPSPLLRTGQAGGESQAWVPLECNWGESQAQVPLEYNWGGVSRQGSTGM